MLTTVMKAILLYHKIAVGAVYKRVLLWEPLFCMVLYSDANRGKATAESLMVA